MIDYAPLYERLMTTPMAGWLDTLRAQVGERLAEERHGDLAGWIAALDALPRARPSSIDLTSASVRIGGADDLDDEGRRRLVDGLQVLHPWRKGPFDLFGVRIDTEWRSDWKWDRLAPHVAPLRGRRILDVGCGNGYHAWRMAGAGADLVVGIDPYLVFVAQFAAMRRYAPEPPVHVLPLGIEELPPGLTGFDTVFSMGVLHHRRSPMDHLLQLKSLLRPGGELVLETLVIEGPNGATLVPVDRYARMRNIWFLPTPQTLAGWLRRCGYRHVRVVDVAPTRTEEQRRTAWMRFDSLAEALDPHDATRTIDGHPAPIRAVLLAETPS
ncbi:MAG: tRNA 5-methoxyuridine(34)/uridine 5-oxyacetic acid(34) synthase CmoB [Rhodothermales bacterium]